jgi:transcription elongation GreA/GreB family factor
VSVAFRRDGDEEHLEPKFEIPLAPGPNLVTARGRKLIDNRVAELTVQVAALGEGAELERMKRDLRYWQTRQITAELVPPPSGATVEFGTNVRFILNGRERTLSIVGHDEADPASGRIAYSAPLSRAMIGAAVGEAVEFGGDADAIEVLAIDVIRD